MHNIFRLGFESRMYRLCYTHTFCYGKTLRKKATDIQLMISLDKHDATYTHFAMTKS